MRCPVCALVANTRGTTEQYEDSYFQGDSDHEGHRDFESDWALEYDSRRFSVELSTPLPTPVPGQRLLDVGAATGTFLRYASAAGWDCFGVEQSVYGRTKIAEKGFAAMEALRDARAHAPFAAITAHHVVEHLVNPVEVLAECREVVDSAGVIVIEVPNWRSGERIAMRDQWIDLRPDQHLYQYGPKALRLLVEKAGFRVTRMGSLGEPIPTRGSLLRSIGIPTGRLARNAKSSGVNNEKVGEPYHAPPRYVETVARLIDQWNDRFVFGRRLYAVGRP